MIATLFNGPDRHKLWDPVPPWVLHIFKEDLLKELAVVQLETQKAALDLQSKAIERSLALLKRG